ncbi:MAG: hypothetical protein KDI59_08085 [Xanthomonadales bacterium]|nr:hypothetical protein [Xanthomonadales bacterium]
MTLLVTLSLTPLVIVVARPLASVIEDNIPLAVYENSLYVFVVRASSVLK